MYDNLKLRLRSVDIDDADFLRETARYIEVTSEQNYNGVKVVSGILDDKLKITMNRAVISISGSICKWYLGDNFQTLGRGDTKRAISKLSDILHLPVNEATVTRIDVAQNFILKQPLPVYYDHFGEMVDGRKRTDRAPRTCDGRIESLYYSKSDEITVFYDKLLEQTVKQQQIPELYQNRNVLRYEQRYVKRLSKSFNCERVTGKMLYDEKFYIELLDKWKQNYFSIRKLNDITINFETMTGKKELYAMGVLALVEMAGGELAMKSQIKEAYLSGKLSKKTAYDLKEAVTDACSVKSAISVKNDAITELDKHVRDAVKFYR